MWQLFISNLHPHGWLRKYLKKWEVQLLAHMTMYLRSVFLNKKKEPKLLICYKQYYNFNQCLVKYHSKIERILENYKFCHSNITFSFHSKMLNRFCHFSAMTHWTDINKINSNYLKCWHWIHMVEIFWFLIKITKNHFHKFFILKIQFLLHKFCW